MSAATHTDPASCGHDHRDNTVDTTSLTRKAEKTGISLEANAAPLASVHPSLGAPGDRVVYVPRALFGGVRWKQTPAVGEDGTASETTMTTKKPEAGPRIEVRVPGAEVPNIFAHRQWHAGMLLSDLIYGGQLCVSDAIVLELGAGTGLPGVVAARFGAARFVLSTDYDGEPLISTLTANIRAACPVADFPNVRVAGHTWGHSIDDIAELIPARLESTHFDVVLLADCIWDGLSHAALLQSIAKLLSQHQRARVYMAAGLHTGRSTIVSFLRRAHKLGLQVAPLDLEGAMSCDGGRGADLADEEVRQAQWPTLSAEEREAQQRLIGSYAAADDGVLLRATRFIQEMELAPIAAVDDAGIALPNGSRQYVADHHRLTGRHRLFVADERPEERRENKGVHLRNRWMTFTALAWREPQ